MTIFVVQNKARATKCPVYREGTLHGQTLDIERTTVNVMRPMDCFGGRLRRVPRPDIHRVEVAHTARRKLHH